MGGFVYLIGKEVWAAMNFEKRELMDKGWSGDRKFCVTDDAGKRYLLRISPIERREMVERTFLWMKKADRLGISMCRAIECGVCEEGVYVLHSWVEGKDAEEMMPQFPGERQYAYGLDAGRALRKIHSLAAEGEHCWEEHFNRKIDRKLKGYEECPLKYEKGEVMIEFIRQNRHLLANRPVTYQHGDFHIGNMMIDNDGNLVIIDFDRDDFGDPWEEFNRIVWSAQCAPEFASGIVDGYFDGDVPSDFWRLLALYIATNTLSSLPWAIPFGEKEISVMRQQCDEVLKWYDDMKKTVPAWYRVR